MSKEQESAADRLWREKIDLCASPRDMILTIILALALVAALVALNL
jgi:hypothetical protein